MFNLLIQTTTTVQRKSGGSGDLRPEVEDRHLGVLAVVLRDILEEVHKFCLHSFGFKLHLRSELFQVHGVQRLTLNLELLDQLVAQRASRSLIQTVNALSVASRHNGVALVINRHLLELLLFVMLLNDVALLVFLGLLLGLLLRNSDAHNRVQLFLNLLLGSLFGIFFSLGRLRHIRLNRSIVHLQQNLGNPSKHLLARHIGNLRLERVNLPESFEDEIEHLGVQTKVFGTVAHNLEGLTLVGRSKQIAQC